MLKKIGEENNSRSVVIVGGGPAGLTAAYELQRSAGISQPVVYEAGSRLGGIARTETHNGFRFDIGGHRFFTKISEVDALWNEVLGSDFMTVQRLSRIYYKGRFFDYPLKFFNALRNTGPYESVTIILSYARWRLRPHPVEETFEQWVTNRFGARLYNQFFRSYTQKVWGIPPSQIRADWAAQRIKDLSLLRAISNAFGGSRNTTSLIENFKYPRLGPGMMWERMGELIRDRGGRIHLDHRVRRIVHKDNLVQAMEVTRQNFDGTENTELVKADHFISTMALRDLIGMFDPPPPKNVQAAAQRLNYRDFLIVTLILDEAAPFPDNWIYVHDPEVGVGRIQNFRAWSPEMLPNHQQSSIGMEYFCNESDAIWQMDDEQLAQLAARELMSLGLADTSVVVDSAVIRQKKAYPVYDSDYKSALEIIRKWLSAMKNFQTVGRNGLHRYNNQDHSMVTAMLAVKNIAGESHDVWSVNVDRAYQEEFQFSNTSSKASSK